MAYDKDKLYRQTVDLVTEKKLIFIEDIVSLLPCGKDTFYAHFPVNSNELDTIKGLLADNKVTMKVAMRKKWFDSEAPALQIGLMKLLSTDEELKKLSMQHNNIAVETVEPIKFEVIPKAED